MEHFIVDMQTEKSKKYYFIREEVSQEIVLLPSQYLMHKMRAKGSPNTIKRSALVISYYLNYLSENQLTMEDVWNMKYEKQQEHFTDFLIWLKAGMHSKDEYTKKPYNETCNAYLKEVFRLYNFAEQQEGCEQSLKVLSDAQYIVRNSVGIRKILNRRSFHGYLKETGHIGRTIEQDKIVILLKACANCRDQVLLLLLAETGFRIGEILGNRYATDIDYENHLIYVNFREDNENDARAKNAEFRKAKVSDATFEILKFYLEEYKDLIFQQEYLLVNVSGKYAGKPMQDSGVRSLMERLEKKTGIKVTPHMLRHYFANTRRTERKNYRSDLYGLKRVIEDVGNIYERRHLLQLFLNNDFPSTPRYQFKFYSDATIKRLNSHIFNMDEQIARALIVHQLLGTRISDTLTLRMDCLREKEGRYFVRIDQVKSITYEKAVSNEVGRLILKAMEYTKERYGETEYVFVKKDDPTKPYQYGMIQAQVMRMIRQKDIRDDNGELLKFGTHIFRHCYGKKLTELHIEDWMIARLLGHKTLQSVHHYRRIGNKVMADETRKTREKMDLILMDIIKGWDGYEL